MSDAERPGEPRGAVARILLLPIRNAQGGQFWAARVERKESPPVYIEAEDTNALFLELERMIEQ